MIVIVNPETGLVASIGKTLADATDEIGRISKRQLRWREMSEDEYFGGRMPPWTRYVALEVDGDVKDIFTVDEAVDAGAEVYAYVQCIECQ